MKKINRRDYLKLIGIGTAGVVSTYGIDLFGQTGKKRRPPKQRTQTPAANTIQPATGLLRWPITNTLPDRNAAFVTVIFAGLMGFCYKTRLGTAPVCEVGFHSGDHHHSLAVRIYRISASGCFPETAPPTAGVQTMSLKIIGGSGTPPQFYQTIDNPFQRTKVGGDNDYDFRWLPDLDDRSFYPENYDKNRHYRARLFISNGTFYTRVRSGSKFKLVNADTDRDIEAFGHVARFMAAAINPLGNDTVRFEVNGRVFKDFSPRDGRYEIIFENECHGCVRNPDHPTNETLRNDFHFNRKVIQLPSRRIKYGLKLDGPKLSSSRNWCETSMALTDEAPCMGAGFGQTNGFP